jgi:membrane-bound ClpP family serine protease
MNKKLTRARLVLAIISTGLEEIAIWAIWRHFLPDFHIRPPAALMIAIMVAWAGFGTWLFIFTTGVLKKQMLEGLNSMVGASGVAAGALDPEGMVKIKGELWRAVAEGGKIEDGEEITVVGENGLKLSVRRVIKGSN